MSCAFGVATEKSWIQGHKDFQRRHPTPVLLLGKSQGWRSLVGCSPWGREESDMIERLHFHFSHSCIGEENGNLLQCSCLENPRDGGACWAAVYGVKQSQTRLSNFTFTFHFHALEKKMATYSSVLAWRIPGTGKPGGLASMGSHRAGQDWSGLAAAAAAAEFVWWRSGKESACQCRRLRFNLWVWKIDWRRKWQPLPVARSRTWFSD